MSNENLLYRNDIVYRPPPEAESILLEVMVGCTYGKCRFCSGQGAARCSVIPIAEIERNAAALASLVENDGKTAVFLLGGNVLSLGMEHLRRVFSIVRRHFPQVCRINMYARAADVLKKTPEELMELREAGMAILYIGVESGSDTVLRMCDKGETSEEILAALRLCDKLNIDYGLSSIIGLGGRENCWEHAVETAKLYNQTHPRTIRVMTLTVWPSTPLHGDVLAGRFNELTPGEILLEERLLLSRLNVENCLFIGTHKSNNIPLAGLLPEHKELLLDMLDEVIVSTDLSALKKQNFNHM